MNTLDASKYRHKIPEIKVMCDRKTPEELIDFISYVTNDTKVHIIICAHYMGELYGYTPERIEQISRLMKYYDVGLVLGVNNEPLHN